MARPAEVSPMHDESTIDRLSLLPEELKRLRQWLVWKSEPDPAGKKPRKVPYYVTGQRRNGVQGSPEDRAQLAAFNQAVQVYEAGGYTGLGVAMLPGSGLIGVDLDDCVTDRMVKLKYAGLVADTYAEVSPSGTGVRGFYLGTYEDRKHLEHGVEVFHSKGFLTITGDMISANPIIPLPESVRAAFDRIFGTQRAKSSQSETLSEAEENDPVLRRLKEWGMVRKACGAGKYWITCPNESQHTSAHGEGDCAYYMPHTNGYKTGNFHCLHAHCAELPQGEFRRLIGIAPTEQTAKPSECPKITLVSYHEISKMEIKHEPLIEGLLGKRESLIISGPSGIGKSAFNNLLTLSAGNPPVSGIWGKFAIPTPLTSLVIQSENGITAQNARLNKQIKAMPELAKGAERVITTMVGNDCRLAGALTDCEFQKTLLDSLQAINADLLVLDPLISYHGQDENDNAAMRRSLDFLTMICDQADVSVILYHHFNRNGQTRGASSIRDWAANMLLMEYAEGGEDGKSIIKITHDKSRNFQQQQPFYLDRTPDLNFLLCEKPGSVQEDHSDAVVECLDALGGCASSQTLLINEVRTRLACGRTTAQRAIATAVRFKKISTIPGKKSGAPSGYELAK